MNSQIRSRGRGGGSLIKGPCGLRALDQNVDRRHCFRPASPPPPPSLPRRRWSTSAACNPTWSREGDGALAGPPHGNASDDALFTHSSSRGGSVKTCARGPELGPSALRVRVCARVCFGGKGVGGGEKSWIRLPNCLFRLHLTDQRRWCVKVLGSERFAIPRNQSGEE